jgi:hypothetical protein
VLPALVGVFLVATAGGPATAAAQSGSRQSGTVRFSSNLPGAPTGLSESAEYQDPNNPGGKPPAVRTIAVHYAQGFKFDTSVPALCTASDSQIQAQGDSACPAESRVGDGGAVFATGFPGPPSTFSVSFDIFNDKNQLIFLAKQPDTGMAIQVSRSTIQDGTITTNIAATPGGPPDGQSTVQSIHFKLNKVTTRRDGAVASYLTTPPACPSSGLWTSTGTFTYADGISQTIFPTTPCLGGQQAGAGTQGGHHTRRNSRHRRVRHVHTRRPRFAGARSPF